MCNAHITRIRNTLHCIRFFWRDHLFLCLRVCVFIKQRIRIVLDNLYQGIVFCLTFMWAIVVLLTQCAAARKLAQSAFTEVSILQTTCLRSTVLLSNIFFFAEADRVAGPKTAPFGFFLQESIYKFLCLHSLCWKTCRDVTVYS